MGRRNGCEGDMQSRPGQCPPRLKTHKVKCILKNGDEKREEEKKRFVVKEKKIPVEF